MAKRAKRVRLVIDASILRAAGDRSVPARSCRDFLEAVLEICHQAVACGELSGEWRRHRSRYSAVWQRRMISRKKFELDSVRVPLKEAVEDLDLTSVRDLRSLTWVNPMRPEDRAIEWLEKMCPREPERSLGRHSGGSDG